MTDQHDTTWTAADWDTAPPEDSPPDEGEYGAYYPEPRRADHAEMAVLGAVLLGGTWGAQALDDTTHLLTRDDFYAPKHGTIWAAATTMHTAGQPVDAVALPLAMSPEDMRKVGGAAYLHHLIGQCPSASSAGFYAEKVAQAAVLRRQQEACVAGLQMATTTRLEEAHDAAADAAARMARVAESTGPGAGPVQAGEKLRQLLEDLDDAERPAEGVQFGWRDLDLDVAPLQPGQLAVLAARPGVGKSVGICNIAVHAALSQGKRVLQVTLEMSSEEVVRRHLAAAAGVPEKGLQPGGELSEAEWARAARALARIQEADLLLEDDPHVDLPTLRGLIRKHRPDLVLVDYVQLMPLVIPKNGSRREALEELTRGLKLTAKDLRVPILIAAQLNRESEKRADKRPHMGDLRETGSLENDADLVMLLHRPDLHAAPGPADEPSDARKGEVEVIVAKQRNGPTPTIRLAAQLPYSRFTDLGGGW